MSPHLVARIRETRKWCGRCVRPLQQRTFEISLTKYTAREAGALRNQLHHAGAPEVAFCEDDVLQEAIVEDGPIVAVEGTLNKLDSVIRACLGGLDRDAIRRKLVTTLQVKELDVEILRDIGRAKKGSQCT